MRMTQRLFHRRRRVWANQTVNGFTEEDVGHGSSAMTSPQTSGHSCTPVGRRHAPIRRSLGRPHDPTPALRAATENKMPETPISLWGASFGTAASGGFSTLLERAREIDWLSKEGTKMRALGRADVLMTQRSGVPKRLLVFTEEGAKYGQTKQSVGSQRKTWALGHQQQPMPQSFGHSCTPVGRRHAPIPRSLGPHDPTPALRTATQKKMPEIPSSLWTSSGTAGSPHC